jgi:hypothetical protein
MSAIKFTAIGHFVHHVLMSSLVLLQEIPDGRAKDLKTRLLPDKTKQVFGPFYPARDALCSRPFDLPFSPGP